MTNDWNLLFKLCLSRTSPFCLSVVFQYLTIHADYVGCLVSVQLTRFIIAQHPLLYRKIMYIFRGKKVEIRRKNGILRAENNEKTLHQAKDFMNSWSFTSDVFGVIRTCQVNNQIMFVGKDVATDLNAWSMGCSCSADNFRIPHFWPLNDISDCRMVNFFQRRGAEALSYRGLGVFFSADLRWGRRNHSATQAVIWRAQRPAV